eukprot:m.242966 g.242966  ORF g.242966 m.242966 type:complete len:86 (+) comp40231_c0_seq7:329-586(+)
MQSHYHEVHKPIALHHLNDVFVQGLDAHMYKNTVDCFLKIWRNEGFFAFYKGTIPRLGRVVFDVAFTFTLYENTMKALDWVFPTQ